MNAITPLQRARLSITRRRGAVLRQVDIASAAGISQARYSSIERGLESTRPEVAELIVRAFRRYGVRDLTELHVLYPQRFMRRQRAS